ncbi:MAG TPA: histidine kinase [Flavobacteriales bacterium]|nr:histidine kinase [Flavobacteriales bacterium]
MKKLFCLLVLIGFYSHSKAGKQKPDSLKALLNNVPKQSSAEMELLSGIGEAYLNQTTYDSALTYYVKTSKLAKKLGNKKFMAIAAHGIGGVYATREKFDLAFKHLSYALRIFEKLNDRKRIAYTEHSLGFLFLQMNDHGKAEYYFLNSLKHRAEINDHSQLNDLHGSLALVYVKQNRIPEAITQLERSNELSKAPGQSQRIALNCGILGTIYYNKKSYDTAIVYFKRALEIGLELNSTHILLSSYACLGDAYFDNNDLKNAKQYFDEFGKLSVKYRGLEKYALTSTMHHNSYRLYEKSGDAKKALFHYRLYHQYNDSLKQIENNKKVKEISILTETKKRDDKINKLKIQNTVARHELEQKQSNQRLILISAVFLILLLFFIFVAVFRSSRQKQKLKLEQIEKERIKTELEYLKKQISPHTMFNSLNTIFFQIDEQKEDAKEMILLFADILRYQLYECNVEFIGLDKEISYLRKFITIQRLRKSDRCRIVFNSQEIPGYILIAPLLLITLVENAFKYVSNDRLIENFVEMKLECDEKRICFEVKNTTYENGMRQKPEEGGIGLTNLKSRLQLIYPGKHELAIVNKDNIFNAKLVLHV